MCNMCRLLDDLDFPLLIAHCSLLIGGVRFRGSMREMLRGILSPGERATPPQRGCVLQPRVGAAPTLGNSEHDDVNPERVVAMSRPRGNEGRNPVGVDELVSVSQGRRCAPTLGWKTQQRLGRRAEY